jgi:hypothetical protein
MVAPTFAFIAFGIRRQKKAPCMPPFIVTKVPTRRDSLIYEGRPVAEVAAYMGHADPAFTARGDGHVFGDAAKPRRVPIEQAIARARGLRRTAEA